MIDLKEIANTPGYGSGQRARDHLAHVAEIKSLLPDPVWMPKFTPAPNIDGGLMLCEFGNSTEDGEDWFITHDMGDMQRDCIDIGSDAMTDAKIVAAILNAYSMGLLVWKDDAA